MADKEIISTLEKPEEITGELLPPEGHDKLGYRVFEILDEILQDKNDLGLPERWNRAYELTRNKHWKRKTDKASLVTANLVASHRQRTVNMLTDNNPTFNIAKIGAEEVDETGEVYDKLLKTCEHWWQDQEQQHILEMSVGKGEEAGYCLEKVTFNPDLEFGKGEVETQVLSLFNVGFYPVDGTIDIQKKEAVLHYWPMTIREAKRRWPQFKDKIRADDDILEELGDQKKEIAAHSGGRDKGYLSTFASTIKNIINTFGMAGKDAEGEHTLIVEAWVKDYTEVKEKDDERSVEISKPKYKGSIRCVTTCNAGEIVLEDRDNPSINPVLDDEQARKTYLYDKFPFNGAQSVTDSDNLWSQGDYEQLEQLNIEVNKTLSQLTLIKDKASRLKIINPKDSGVANSEFTNYPGVIRPSNATVAQGIRYMDFPKMPADLVKALEIYKDFFFLVSGSFELEQAQVPGREVIAYKAIAALLERATTMLKGKLRNYGKLIRVRGRMYIGCVQNWYTEDRWITYQEDGEDISLKIRGTDMIFPAKLTVVSGSTMPRSKIQEREEAIALAKMGKIDNEELLKKLDWPDRKNVIKRMMAGPYGMLFDKMLKTGVPPNLIKIFKHLSEMDQKEFERKLKAGEIPMFEQVFKLMLKAGMGKQQQQPLTAIENAEIQQKNAEIQIKGAEARADIEKKLADAALVREKIVSERVEQWVKAKGVGFDEQQLNLQRASFMADIDKTKKEQKLKVAEIITKSAESRGQGPYRERGMKSNNQE